MALRVCEIASEVPATTSKVQASLCRAAAGHGVLSCSQLFLEARNNLSYEILKSGCRNADERTFYLVPGFKSLVSFVVGDGVECGSSWR